MGSLQTATGVGDLVQAPRGASGLERLRRRRPATDEVPVVARSTAGRRPSVSVVIPCYNYGSFLEAAVRSVLEEQPGVDVRVLVIDDASPDGSGEIARNIAANNQRVEVSVHRRNVGHIATYNEGLLDWASGDYCVLLSADDRLTPGALSRATALLDACPDVGFAYGNVVWFADGDPLPSARTAVRGWSVRSGQEWLERSFRWSRTGIVSPEVVARTELQHRVGGYDRRLTHVGDQEMWLRFAAHADVGFVRGADQAYYRRHGRNMSSGYGETETLQQFRAAFDSVLCSYGDRLPDPTHLSSVGRRRLAWEALVTAARSYDKGRVDPTTVQELLDFAVDCWPDARGLMVYRTLKLRQSAGPRAARMFQPLTLPAAGARRVGTWRRNRSWLRHG